jgi:hypothetical protein
MFQSGQTQKHPEWRLIVERLSAAEYGTEIPHATMAEITGLRHGTRRYFQQVAKAMKILRRDHDRELVSMSGKGYRLLLPGEFENEARRQSVFGLRRQVRCVNVLEAAPEQLLTPEQRRKLADSHAKHGKLISMHRSTLQQSRPSYLPPASSDTPKMLAS